MRPPSWSRRWYWSWAASSLGHDPSPRGHRHGPPEAGHGLDQADDRGSTVERDHVPTRRPAGRHPPAARELADRAEAVEAHPPVGSGGASDAVEGIVELDTRGQGDATQRLLGV